MRVSSDALARRITPATVLAAASTQLRVLNALMLRETKTRYGNHKIGFLWALIEPAATVTLFVAIFSTFRQDSPGGIPLAMFLLTGLVSFNMFRDTWNQMQGSIAGSRQLLAFPQVTTFDVMLSKGLLELGVSLFVFAFLLFMAFLLGYDIDVQRPLGVLAAMGLLGLFGMGAGFFFGAIEPLVPSVKQFMNQVVGRPLYFGSGLFFTIDALPPAVVPYLMWNPILHLIELVRSEYFEVFETSHASWLYASGCSFGMLAAGLLTHRALRKRTIAAK